MTYKINISEAAERDLNAIFEYIAVRLQNKEATIDFAKEVEKKYILLSEHPLMFPLSRDVRLKRKGYRKVSVKNYVMVYRVEPNKPEVFIARFFYGKRDFEKYI